MELLFFCIQVSLACLAIHVVITHNGMLFNWIQPHLEILLHPELRKPMYECMNCMASLWTIFFWCVYVKPISFDLLFAILIVSGMNKLICAFLEKATEYGC